MSVVEDKVPVVAEPTEGGNLNGAFARWLEQNAEWISDFRQLRKVFIITRSISGIISLVSSITLAYLICRSKNGLSTTFHRLLLGLAVSNIIYSFAWSIFSVSVPQEMRYLIWGARGNQGTCDAQAFVIHVGALAGVFYNCSLCVYYLCVLKYSKVQKLIFKVEICSHVVSIGYPLLFGIVGLATNAFNPFGSICWVTAHNPPHCRLSDSQNGQLPDGFSIPCGRGEKVARAMLLLFNIPINFIGPAAIIFTMTVMYYYVLAIEKKTEKYHTNTLLQQGPKRTEIEDNVPDNCWERMILSCVKKTKNIFHKKQTAARSNSRRVLHRAFMYSAAYFLSYSFLLVGQYMTEADVHVPDAIWFLSTLLSPLQGFFNFLIYFYPKVLAAKNDRRSNFTWSQAIAGAFFERERKTQSTGRGYRHKSTRHVNSPTKEDEKREDGDEGADISPSPHNTNLPPTLASNNIEIANPQNTADVEDQNISEEFMNEGGV